MTSDLWRLRNWRELVRFPVQLLVGLWQRLYVRLCWLSIKGVGCVYQMFFSPSNANARHDL